MPQPAHRLYQSDLTTDIVVGMSDGLTIPFVLAAGLSGALSSNTAILTIGAIGIAAGALAMGLARYLAERTEAGYDETALLTEAGAYRENPDQETRHPLAELGLSPETREIIAGEMARDKEKWAETMSAYHLEEGEPDPAYHRKSAWNIGISYLIAGMIPYSPYLFTEQPVEGLKWSAALTIACFLLFGFFKARVTSRPPWAGALRMALTGVLAAGAAFLLGGLFQIN